MGFQAQSLGLGHGNHIHFQDTLNSSRPTAFPLAQSLPPAEATTDNQSSLSLSEVRTQEATQTIIFHSLASSSNSGMPTQPFQKVLILGMQWRPLAGRAHRDQFILATRPSPRECSVPRGEEPSPWQSISEALTCLVGPNPPFGGLPCPQAPSLCLLWASFSVS